MDYIIKGIDERFWHEVKILAAYRNTTIKDLIFSLLKKEIAKEEKKRKTEFN